MRNVGLQDLTSYQFQSSLIRFTLLVFLGLPACSWPWPSVEVDSQGLGPSDIARLLKDRCCTNDEDQIARDITLALVKAKAGRSLRASAESIGFICEDLPSRACKYAGENKYRFYNLPKGHEGNGKIHIAKYFIVLPDYDDPKNVRVQQINTIDQ